MSAGEDQYGLFDEPDADFDGATYEPEFDHERLHGQLALVYEMMRDHDWHTLAELATHAHGSEAGVSARVRDLRKEKFGGHLIERRRAGDPTAGLWEYRMPRPTTLAEIFARENRNEKRQIA